MNPATTSAALDAAQASTMLDWLGHERVELAAIHDGQIEVSHPSDREAAIQWLAARNGEFGLYICTNQVFPEHFGRNRRAKAEDISDGHVLLLDIDPERNDSPAGRALLAAIAMLARVCEIDSRPLLVDSGRGAQILIRIPEGADRVAVWEEVRDEFSRLLSDYGCKLDPTHDAARLCRMPGTINLKTGRVARIITLPEKLPRHLTETLSGKRRDLNDHSRSGFEMAAADALAAFGFDQEGIAQLLAAYPHGRGEAGHPSSRRTTVRKAFTRSQTDAQPPKNEQHSSITREQARVMLPELLAKNVEFLQRYLSLSNSQVHVLALWIVHTYSIEAADSTPYLNIFSPEKRAGKTRLLEVLSLLVRRPWFSSNASAAAIARIVSERKPSVLLDEADAFFAATESERSETLRGILNAGFRRGGAYSRCVGQGAAMKVEDLDVFSPKAIAGLRELPDTLADRSIPIRMKRALPGEIRERFYRRDVEPIAAALREGIEECIHPLVPLLKETRPERVHELNDRQFDIAEPLLAIAALAGDHHWPERARTALLDLFAPERDAESLAVRLLSDIWGLFRLEGEASIEAISTEELLKALHGIEDAPWADFSRGKSISGHTLAKILGRFGIHPEKWRDGPRTVRGYKAEAFTDAWARYLPPDPVERGQSATPPQPLESQTSQNKSCGVVADQNATGNEQAPVEFERSPDIGDALEV